MAKKSLGRGVNILIPDYDATEEEAKGAEQLKIIDIEPNADQPRKQFDAEKLNVLTESIKLHGVIQPIVVVRNGDMYKIIAGERRWRAAKMAGLKQIPAVIREYSDNAIMEISLIENLQRENLNPIEEGLGYKYLIENFGMTQEKVSERVGKSRSSIANALRILNLPEKIQKMIESGIISGGHAKAILSLTKEGEQLTLANLIADKGLSVREAENYVKQLLKPKPLKKKEDKQLLNYLMDVESELSRSVGSKVKIHHGKGKGKIEIEYYSNEDLERIMNILKST